jgi:hypothetical protein
LGMPAVLKTVAKPSTMASRSPAASVPDHMIVVVEPS